MHQGGAGLCFTTPGSCCCKAWRAALSAFTGLVLSLYWSACPDSLLPMLYQLGCTACAACCRPHACPGLLDPLYQQTACPQIGCRAALIRFGPSKSTLASFCHIPFAGTMCESWIQPGCVPPRNCLPAANNQFARGCSSLEFFASSLCHRRECGQKTPQHQPPVAAPFSE